MQDPLLFSFDLTHLAPPRKKLRQACVTHPRMGEGFQKSTLHTKNCFYLSQMRNARHHHFDRVVTFVSRNEDALASEFGRPNAIFFSLAFAGMRTQDFPYTHLPELLTGRLNKD